MKILRIVPNIAAGDPASAKGFYRDILGLDVAMDVGWTATFAADASMRPQLNVAAHGGSGTAVPDLNWYFAYNLFRLAGITQGIAGRIRDGTAASAKAMESAKRTVPLSKASWAYAQKAGAV